METVVCELSAFIDCAWLMRGIIFIVSAVFFRCASFLGSPSGFRNEIRIVLGWSLAVFFLLGGVTLMIILVLYGLLIVAFVVVNCSFVTVDLRLVLVLMVILCLVVTSLRITFGMSATWCLLVVFFFGMLIFMGCGSLCECVVGSVVVCW